MLKKLALGLLTVMGAILVFAAIKPAEYTVYREVTVSAPAEKLFPLISSARENGRWMPWAEMDPQMRMTYSGPESGVGSKASWESPGKMGMGSSTVSESIENRVVRYRLEYMKPFQMQQTSEISIVPSGDQSIVRWSVSGHSQFIGRVMCLFMNMDKMVGGSFEKGLAKLKEIAERS